MERFSFMRLLTSVLLVGLVLGGLLLFLRETQPTRDQVSLDARIYAAKLILNITENGTDDISKLRVISLSERANGTGFEIIYEDESRKVQLRLVNLNTGEIFSPDENGKYHLPDYSQRYGEYEYE